MTGGVDWLLLAEFSIVGVLAGGVLALIALGFVLVYKATDAINFAQGVFVMIAGLVVGGGLGNGRHLACPTGTPMTNLFLTLLERMGVGQETLGDSTGRLSRA